MLLQAPRLPSNGNKLVIRRVVLGFAAHSGEAVVFGVSGVVLVYEYQRSKVPTWV